MPCTEALPPPAEASLSRRSAGGQVLTLALSVLVAGCARMPTLPPRAPAPAPPPAPPAAPAPGPAAEAARPAPPPAPSAPVPAPATAAATPPARPAARAPRYVQLAPPPPPRNPAELRLQMARRLVAAHPDTSYTHRAPDRLLAIPVLEVELHADGSVRHVAVLRRPSTGDQAVRLAIDAVHRAAPYGNVSRLPKPWKVVETFLFDDDLRFKPRTLDLK